MLTVDVIRGIASKSGLRSQDAMQTQDISNLVTNLSPVVRRSLIGVLGTGTWPETWHYARGIF
jgi:hypothetical protein